jgi:hypothetical protein
MTTNEIVLAGNVGTAEMPDQYQKITPKLFIHMVKISLYCRMKNEYTQISASILLTLE